MAVKVTKGQICDGSISKKLCHKEYNLHGKFHNCIKNCTTIVLCCSTIIHGFQSYISNRSLRHTAPPAADRF